MPLPRSSTARSTPCVACVRGLLWMKLGVLPRMRDCRCRFHAIACQIGEISAVYHVGPSHLYLLTDDVRLCTQGDSMDYVGSLLESLWRVGVKVNSPLVRGDLAGCSAVLVGADLRVSGMNVDGLEIFAFDGIGENARVGIQTRSDVAHHVFDELGILIGALGDVLLVRAFNETEYLARGLLFHQGDELLDEHVFRDARADGDVRTLVVRAVARYLFGARAQTGDGHHHLERNTVILITAFTR